MDTWTEQNGEAAKIRLTRQYEACVDELIAGVDHDNRYVLDGETLDEYTLLGRLMVRAGVAWTCLDRACGCINVQRNLSCDNCGRRRSKMRDVPKQDTSI